MRNSRHKAGTVRKLTVHDTPKHNGVFKRLNCTLMEKVQAMLLDSDLPKFLWAEAVSHAVYLKNWTWTCMIGYSTPYKILNSRKLNIGNLHQWGCKVQVHHPGDSKLDGHSFIGCWMGFDAKTKDGHRVYWPERRMVTVERSVKFNFEPEEVVVGALPLEGKEGLDECLTAIEPKKHQTVSKTSDTILIPAPEDEFVTEGRGKHIQKETKYVKLLKGGSGVTGIRVGVLPRGMQHGSTIINSNLLADKNHTTAAAASGPEVDYAMATATEGAEGLTPTYEEACKCPD